ncbi:MAG: HAD family hydrolase [Muribaculaceae bacterium]|nr:HAD family hydrolase [Muribaculaceae bacterium]
MTLPVNSNRKVSSRTLYVSDLDGTLLDSSVQIPESAVETLNRAIDCGAMFTVATARTPGTLCHLLRDVHLRLPAIVMTGATMWQRETNTYTDTCYFHPATVASIRDVYRRYGLSSFIYTLRDDMITVYHQGPLSDMERDFIRARLRNPYKRFMIRPDGESDIPVDPEDVVLFFAMQPSDVGHPAFEALGDVEGVNPMFYNDANYPEIAMIEAFPRGATKALAIKRLARQTGAERIVVFGDNFNDLPMFDIADTAVAVSNAIPEVKERADIVTGHHDTGAVADFILNDFLTNMPPAAASLLEF